MIMLRWTAAPRRWPVVVELPGGGMSVYGQNPRWETAVFAGHCVRWLPELQRLVDPTIQQFPELSGEDGPFIGRVGAASQALPGELPVGSDIPIPRNGAQIMYTVAATKTSSSTPSRPRPNSSTRKAPPIWPAGCCRSW